MNTTTHRPKRPFQPTLDTYLNRRTALSSHPASFPASPPSPPTHTPPSQIQSSLLSVGMRVRKAVPSGYQTKSLDAAYKTSAVSAVSSASASFGGNSRRLEPLCGMHKIGGYGTQSYAPFSIDQENAQMSFISSQESNISSLSATSEPCTPSAIRNPDKKRTWMDEEEDEGMDGDCEDNSAFSVMMRSSIVRRKIKPLIRRRDVALSTGAGAMEVEDFGDAAFLMPPD
ncbi:MAG: hypothetical protein Q9162_005268 [Coniocarpon cinnabarinum]